METMNGSVHISTRTIQRLKRIRTLLEQLQPESAPRALTMPGSPAPRDAIIVFPGSFNAPTTSHLALLQQAQHYARQHAPMQLYVAMSKLTIDKEAVERPLMLDRIMLLDTLLRHHLPQAGILLFNRGLYVEQAQAVHTSFPHVTRLLFLMGFDKIVQIFDPRYYSDREAALRTLFASAELLVAPRGDAGPEALTALLSRPENQLFAHFVHALAFSSAYRDISSTQIRESASTHLDEIPYEVQRFMLTTHAYDPPLRLPDGSEFDYYAERIKTLGKLLKPATDGR